MELLNEASGRSTGVKVVVSQGILRPVYQLIAVALYVLGGGGTGEKSRKKPGRAHQKGTSMQAFTLAEDLVNQEKSKYSPLHSSVESERNKAFIERNMKCCLDKEKQIKRVHASLYMCAETESRTAVLRAVHNIVPWCAVVLITTFLFQQKAPQTPHHVFFES